jgi:hypothetical protein
MFKILEWIAIVIHAPTCTTKNNAPDRLTLYAVTLKIPVLQMQDKFLLLRRSPLFRLSLQIQLQMYYKLVILQSIPFYKHHFSYKSSNSLQTWTYLPAAITSVSTNMALNENQVDKDKDRVLWRKRSKIISGCTVCMTSYFAAFKNVLKSAFSLAKADNIQTIENNHR